MPLSFQSRPALPAPAADQLAARHPHRHERAYAYLKGLLLDGGLEPGELISTESVGRALGISRAPVTDAVKRLTAEGFFEVLPQVGCRVSTPRAQEVADFYALFAGSEALITRFAAERRSADEAGEFEYLVGELMRQARRVGASARTGPILRALNRRRHEAIHRLAQSPLAAEIVAHFWDRSDFYVRLAFGGFVPPREAAAAQAAIARAIVAGAAATAEKLTRDYLCQLGVSAAARLRPA